MDRQQTTAQQFQGLFFSLWLRRLWCLCSAEHHEYWVKPGCFHFLNRKAISKNKHIASLYIIRTIICQKKKTDKRLSLTSACSFQKVRAKTHSSRKQPFVMSLIPQWYMSQVSGNTPSQVFVSLRLPCSWFLLVSLHVEGPTTPHFPISPSSQGFLCPQGCGGGIGTDSSCL